MHVKFGARPDTVYDRRASIAPAMIGLVIVLALIALPVARANAQHAVPLTIAEAEDLALAAEPGQQALRARAASLKEQAIVSGALPDPMLRLEHVLAVLEQEIEILQIEGRIRSRVKSQMERSQKEYYLNEQMRAIQQEMGDKDDRLAEINELEEKAKAKQLSEEARSKVEKEIKKLKSMSPQSAEVNVVRSYIDWILAMP